MTIRTTVISAGFLLGIAPMLACAGVTTRVSVATDGSQGSDYSHTAALSADGRLVAFQSAAAIWASTQDLVDDAIFVRDRQAGTTTLVSGHPSDVQPGYASGAFRPAISADGRFVAFNRGRFVGGPSVYIFDVFVSDLTTGAIVRISAAPDGSPADGSSGRPMLSADGRLVAFSSAATNLVPGDTNGVKDVFLHDRDADGDGVFDEPGGVSTIRVSVASDGSQSNGWSGLDVDYGPGLSADGRFVVFDSGAGNLVPNDTPIVAKIMVHDCLTGVTARVGFGYSPAISADGRIVAYESSGVILAYDRVSDSYMQVSPPSTSSYYSVRPTLSGDGRFVAYLSDLPNLVSDDTNGVQDVFVYDRDTGTTSRASVDSSGTEQRIEGDATSGLYSGPAVSTDGRFVAFASDATNLVAGDTNTATDVFVYDRSCGDGVLEGSEQCDDGNLDDGDGCERDCTLSLGSGPTTMLRPMIALSGTAGPPGHAGLSVTAQLAFAPGLPELDPVNRGAQVLIADLGTPGAALVALTSLTVPIPPGGAGGGCGGQDGWRVSRGTYAYVNRSNALPPACSPGSANGLTSIAFRDLRNTKGVITFSMRLRKSHLTLPVGPLRATVVLGATAADGAAGAYGTYAFASARCVRRGSAVRCR